MGLAAILGTVRTVDTGLAAGISALFGLVIGSFLNVVIWRVPRQESVRRPGSHCPACGEALRWRDNIPLLSWLALRGRCRHCRTSVSFRYPLVELSTAVLFAVVGARFHDDVIAFGMLGLTASLIALSAIDFEHFLLPNRVIYPTAAICVPLFALAAAIDGDWSAFGRAALGALISFAIFYAIWFIVPNAMGFGDVRLSALLGFASAYLGWPVLVLALFLPFLLGSIGGLAMAAPIVLVPMTLGGLLGYASGVSVMTSLGHGEPPADPARARVFVAIAGAVMLGAIVYFALSMTRRVQRGRHIPFGPYLAAGALIAILVHG